MTLLLVFVAVVLVNKMVEPAQTLMTPCTDATGIVEKLVLVTTGVCPHKDPAKQIAKEIKNNNPLCNFPPIRFYACNQIYGGLTDKKNKCCRTKGLPYFTLFFRKGAYRFLLENFQG